VNTGTSDGATIMSGAFLDGANLDGVLAERVVGWQRE
jgi:hypothetical protein